MRLPLAPDERSEAQRAEALDRAREQDSARAKLNEVLNNFRAALGHAEDTARKRSHRGRHVALDDAFWKALDRGYRSLDAYLDHLVELSEIQLSCKAGCAACCTAAPSVLVVEGLRMVRALRRKEGGHLRAQRAVDQSRRFQALFQKLGGETSHASSGGTLYKQAQLAWRSLGQPCPILGDDGRCTAYESRPIACRAYVAVEDPAQCEPRSPRFLQAEHPRIWSDLREAEVEQTLARIGDVLELPNCPNLQWAIARTHDHPDAKA